jgi:DUF1680 family protein
MTEQEFKENLSLKMLDLADLFLSFYSPCKVKDGRCVSKDMNSFSCCYNNILNNNTNPCEYLGEKGCTIRTLGCKLYLCPDAREVETDCAEIFDLLYKIVDKYKIYGVK